MGLKNRQGLSGGLARRPAPQGAEADPIGDCCCLATLGRNRITYHNLLKALPSKSQEREKPNPGKLAERRHNIPGKFIRKRKERNSVWPPQNRPLFDLDHSGLNHHCHRPHRLRLKLARRRGLAVLSGHPPAVTAPRMASPTNFLKKV